jgi:hypothetical protein
MAWSDFNATCRGGYGFTPQDPRAQDTVVSPEFASYWLEVAAGRSSDYDPEHGERSEKLWADIAAGRTPGYRPGHAGA